MLVYKVPEKSNVQEVESFEVWTDGSTSKNGKSDAKCGWAFAVLNFKGEVYIRYGSYVPNLQTNNRAEMIGVIAAIIDLAQPGRKLHIRSDSQYVINTVVTWRKNWYRRDPRSIKNKQLFEKLFHLVDNNLVTFEWVKGHAGCAGNELVDFWAGMGLKNKQPSLKHSMIANIKFIETIQGVEDND